MKATIVACLYTPMGYIHYLDRANFDLILRLRMIPDTSKQIMFNCYDYQGQNLSTIYMTIALLHTCIIRELNQ